MNNEQWQWKMNNEKWTMNHTTNNEKNNERLAINNEKWTMNDI